MKNCHSKKTKGKEREQRTEGGKVGGKMEGGRKEKEGKQAECEKRYSISDSPYKYLLKRHLP